MTDEGKGKGTGDALLRIVAMLVSLATLSARASAAPLPVRILVLWIMRFAEGRARPFVAQLVDLPPEAFDAFPFTRTGDSADDLLALATCLYNLALVLEWAVAEGRCNAPACHAAITAFICELTAVGALFFGFCAAPEPYSYDTS